MKNFRMYLFGAVALITMLACSTISSFVATPTPAPTNTPFPTSTPLPTATPVSAVLFEDGEFTNSCFIGGTDTVDRFVEDGQFKMVIKEPSLVAWTECTQDQFTDFVFEVDATQLSGPDNNVYGMIFRFNPDVNEFYVFAISGDGYYVVALDGPDRSEPDLLIEWAQTDKINLGNATNHLKVEAVGNGISYYINGTFLGTIENDQLSSGTVGTFVGSVDDGGVLIGYDNMKVTSP